MPDSTSVPHGLHEAVLEAALEDLGGEQLDGSGFEGETPLDIDAEPPVGDAQ